MNVSTRSRVLSDDETRLQVARQSEATSEPSGKVAEDPNLSLGFAFSTGQEGSDDSRVELRGRSPAVDEGSSKQAEDPAAVSLALRARSSALDIARGLPNLTFGPPGPDGRPLGAVRFASTPVQGSPVQITWSDFNEADTMAGSYWDEVWVTNEGGQEVFRDRVRPSGLAPGGNEGHYVVWTPMNAGTHTAFVQLNSGQYAIPEDRIDDNLSQVSTVVASRYGRHAHALEAIAVREVSGPEGMNQRYGEALNIGTPPFYGSMRARYDYTRRFIWLLWPHRARPDDAAASVDIDLTIELFQEDPRYNSSAAPVDRQTKRIRLGEDVPFGYEYSRLPEGADFFLRITFIDYSQTQDAGYVLWTQGYG